MNANPNTLHDEELAGAINALERALANEATSNEPVKRFTRPINTILAAAKRDISELDRLRRKVVQLEGRIVRSR